MRLCIYMYLSISQENLSFVEKTEEWFFTQSKKLHGEFISFSCNRGYWLNGPSERLCLNNGSWTGVQPTCKFGMSFTR